VAKKSGQAMAGPPTTALSKDGNEVGLTSVLDRQQFVL